MEDKSKIWYNFLILMSLLILLSSSCKKKENDRTFTIGESYGGGIIFYVDNDGKHGLIAATSNQSNAPWGCEGTNITGTSTLIGGQANTNAIVNGCSTAGIAARICDQLVLNGYSDWFLPSKTELNLMHTNLHYNGQGGFNIGAPYWSSSQFASTNAYGWDFSDEVRSYVGIFVTKNSSIYVRAIRAF
jgi:hypothetical protein